MQQESLHTGRVNVEECTDPAEWNLFVSQNYGSPYAKWEWTDLIKSTYGHDCWYFTATVDNEIVGAVPIVHIGSRLFGQQLVSVPFAGYGSVILGDSYREEATDALLTRIRDLADEIGVDYVSLRGRDLGDEPHPDFEHRTRYVSLQVPVDNGPEAAWDNFESNRQGHIRQGRENVSVRVGDSLDDLRTFYGLYLRRMRGHGSPPHPFSFFEQVWDAYYSDGQLRLYLAFADGTPVNGIIDLLSGSTVYGWKEASNYEYRGLEGGSLLNWKSIEWAAENGYETVDLGRTREGSGVYMFKKTFGGEKVWMDDYHYFPSGNRDLLDAEDEEYEPLKRVWRRLPLPVTRLIGPRIRGHISL